MSDKKAQAEGMLAEFDSPGALLAAAEKVREEGYDRFDCHSPFPIHGMDQAMGMPKSKLGFVAMATGLAGGTIAFLGQTWVHSAAYTTNFSGKPFFAAQAYVPVTFELTILGAAFGAVGGMLLFNMLPMWYHPVFHSERFAKATDDGFFVSIDALDTKFDVKKTMAFLQSIGGKNVEVLRAKE